MKKAVTVRMNRQLAVLVSAVLVLGLWQVPAMAAAKKKITTLSLTVENTLQVGEDYSEDDIDIEIKNGHCFVGEIQILNEDDYWKSDDIPKISVTLNAEEGYYFSVSKDNVKIKGATYVSGKRENSETLVLTMTLPSMLETISEIKEVWWMSNHEVEWSEVENAGQYEVRVYRDDKSTGGIQRVIGTKLDLGPLMRKAGTYKVRVRAINRKNTDVKTEWLEIDSNSSIDDETARQFRDQYGSQIPAGAKEPGDMLSQSYTQDQYGWIHDAGGWWYRNTDGTYTVNNWQQIDGKWYFFNSTGYMVTGWIDWQDKSYYCDPINGDMQTDKVIQDGSGRRVDSTGAWIE